MTILKELPVSLRPELSTLNTMCARYSCGTEAAEWYIRQQWKYTALCRCLWL